MYGESVPLPAQNSGGSIYPTRYKLDAGFAPAYGKSEKSLIGKWCTFLIIIGQRKVSFKHFRKKSSSVREASLY